MSAAARLLRELSATSVLRAAVLALAATVFWWSISVPAGIAAAALGALLAALAADRLVPAAPRLRTLGVVVVALLASLIGAWLARGVLRADFVSEWIGSVPALHLAEALRGLFFTAPVVFVLRYLAVRHPATAPLEVGVVAAGFVAAVAAHREGMIHRPLPLGDFAWAHGLDPTLLLLGVGVVSAVLLAALLMREQGRSRIALHLGTLAALVLLLVLGVRLGGLPQPRQPQELGLTGEGGDEELEAGGKREQGTRPNDLDFRDDYRSDGGRAPVAVVVLHDEYEPNEGAYYFRQSALSRYNGQRLVQATRADVDRDLVDRFPNAPISLEHAPPAAETRRALHTTTGVLVDHVKPFAIDAPVSLAPVGREDPRFRRVYEAVSLVREEGFETLFGRAGGDADWNAAQRAYYTEPPADLRYAALAEQVLESLRPEFRDDPLARALAIKSYLDRAGTYSLKSSHASAEDPVASFLFGDLTGYCVHFAHAAVYLMRELGVPSRVATGYAVPAEDRGSGSTIMIRGLNAHAWPEVYIEGAGWVVVDLQPERVLDQMAAAPDSTLQMMLGQMLRDGTRETQLEPPPPPVDWAALVRDAAFALLLALAAGFVVKLYRRLAPRFAPERQLARVAYRAALDQLASVGVRRRVGEGRERFGARAAQRAPSFGELTRVHVASAWGRVPARDRRALSERVAGLARELRGSVPLWRRLLGALNPYSWLLAR